MSNKILVRGLEDDVFYALESMARASDRSLEAEARHALRNWVQPVLNKEERSARCKQLSQRLDSSLEQINSATRKRWRPSHIAEAIGESTVESVENWYLGWEEPTFQQLQRIAEHLGLSRNWLHHGDGAPFPVGDVRLSEDPTKAARWLLNLPADPQTSPQSDQPAPPFPGLKRLILVRAADELGSFAIVKQRDDHRCVTYRTGMNISEEIGATGEAQLMALSVTLELLCKLPKGGVPLITSWIVPDKMFNALRAGTIHPLSLDDGSVTKLWWEDFWDESMSNSKTYWHRWPEITTRICKAVDVTKRLAHEREQIRTGDHPALTTLATHLSR